MSVAWSLPSGGSSLGGKVRWSTAPTEIAWTTGSYNEEEVIAPTRISIQNAKSWADRERELARIANFGADWDGLGAGAPDRNVIERANIFFRILRAGLPGGPPMRILFSSDNTISFEWVIGSEFVQAEVSRDREVEWMFATAGEEPQFETGIVDDPTTLASRQGQEWQPAPAVAEEPDYASAQ